MAGKTLYTQKEAIAAFREFMTDLARLEAAVGRWRVAVFQIAMLGGANCQMVKAYNQAALDVWDTTNKALKEFREAVKGTSVQRWADVHLPPYPPEPTMLGYGLSTYLGRTVVTLDCTANELLDPKRLKSFGSQPGWPCSAGESNPAGKTLQGDLGIAMTAAAPVVCGTVPSAIGCLIAGGFVLGGLALINKIFSHVETIYLGTDRLNLKARLADYENNAKAAEHARDCMLQGRDPAACNAEAARLFPRSSAPYAGSGIATVLWATVALVATGGVVYLLVRRSKSADEEARFRREERRRDHEPRKLKAA